jgi:hypothetical protein
MNTVKRIGPGSAFKVGLVIYGLLGVILGAFVGLAGLLGTLFPASDGMPPNRVLLVALAMGAPIAYAVFGGAMAAVGAFIYNVAARWVGGLQVEMN